MSDMYDDDPRNVPLPRASSLRTRIVVLAAVGLAVFFFLLTTFASLWTDHLWFASVHYSGVFTRLFWLRTSLFVVFGLVMGGSVAGAMLSAYYWRPPLHIAGMTETGLDRYRDAVTPIRTWLLVGVSAIAGVFAGTSAVGKWRAYLLWQDGGSFHQKDPYFHKDIGFYVFDLPWYQFVVGFLMATVIVALLAATVVHYLYGGIRLQVPDKLTGPAQVQLSVMLALFVLFKGIDYWLDRFDLVHGQVHSAGSAFTGIGYTADHVLLPAKSILAGIALICAVLFAVNAWRRTWLLPSVGLSLMVVSAVLLGLIWPAIVQGFVVSPSQDKELPYVATNIKQTRLAYGISSADVTADKYTTPANATTGDAAGLDQQASSVPLVDPDLVKQLFQESQQVRGYYSVAKVLDVDHYEIQGHDRALVLGVRELDQSGIDTNDRNWTNLHTVYTHGSGVIAAFANQRDASNSAESPDIQWAQGTGDDYLQQATGPFQHQIYFGERSTSYSVVGKPAGAKPVELDLGTSGSSDSTTTYAGGGGVKIGSTFRRLLYALKFGSANFLLSERVNQDSQVLYDRTPRERVAKVAPWLTLDNDVYPVVEGGHILWVVDGYTTTDRYPGSELDSFQSMTDDSLQQDTGLHTVPTDNINYMRNAVKATVDAYTGQVKLYAWDESDPILQAWEKAFPGTVQPKHDIPSDLLAHLRYPEDLFKVQRYQLATYHVTSPSAFISSSDKWAVPTDPSTPEFRVPPYRTFIDGPTGQQVWSLTSTFTPAKRSNLAAVMTVDSDPRSADYGNIRLLERPTQQTEGPGQVVNDFKNDPGIAQALQAFRGTDGGALFGNLITVPTADKGLMYVEPVYAEQISGATYPVLAYVLVSYDGRVGHGRTLLDAITSALSSTPPPPAPTPTPTPTPTPSPSTGPSAPGSPTSSPSGTAQQQAASLLTEAESLFAKADEAGKKGEFAQREDYLQQAQEKVAAAVKLLKK